MDPEELEQFSLGRVSDEESERFEEHLLVCEPCRQSLEQTEAYVFAMRAASKESRRESASRQPWWSVARLVLAVAGLALLALGVLTIAHFTRQAPPPLAVMLTATRGTVPGGAAPAGRPLALTPDVTGINAPGPYRLEIVDQRGGVTWQGKYDPAAGAVRVPAQRAGTHFVRVYAASGELLREYGLDIQRQALVSGN